MSVQEESVLAIGSDPILLSLSESWIDSVVSDYAPGAQLDLHVKAIEDHIEWGAIIRQYSLVLYVSHNGDLMQLRKIEQACIAEKIPMLPAVVYNGIGLVGPLLLPSGSGCWDSAWRCIHTTVFYEDQQESISKMAISLLMDVLVHEGRKVARREQELACKDQIYICNPMTLTGSWHPIRIRPPVSGYTMARPAENILRAFKKDRDPADQYEWFTCFTQLTSDVTGIFHEWTEADCNQLPLAQCRVQPIDPLSAGPARLLPPIVQSGLTHEEARRESGLAGIEAYAARLLPHILPGSYTEQQERIGIGAGFSAAEAVGRGLVACLNDELTRRLLSNEHSVTRLQYTQIQDEHCRFYLQAISILGGEPLFAMGEPLYGFPVMWIHADSAWYGSVDLNMTLALRQSLLKALTGKDRSASSMHPPVWNNRTPQDITISSSPPRTYKPLVQSAVQTLNRNNKRLEVLDMHGESFLGEETSLFVCGIILGEEESP